MISTKKFTQEQIKEINRVNVINFIKETYPTTKQEISKALGISIPTVTTNIKELVEIGLVEQVGIAKSTGGRKPVVIGFVENARYAFGVSISRKSVWIRLINLAYEVIDEVELPYIDMEMTLNKIETTIDEMISSKSIDRNKVVGLGISLPGVVNDEELVLKNAPNLRVENYDFTPFQERVGFKVWIENEANIGALAEVKVGNAVGIDNLVYVSITEGIGTGLIIQDHIYKSNQKKAGEFGHSRISDEKRQCNCGRYGCWELYASEDALIRYYKESSNTNIDHVAEVFSAFTEGSVEAKEALIRYVEYLFYGFENIILGLNPDYLVIGGDFGKYNHVLSEAMVLAGKMKKERMYYEDTKIIFSGLEDKGPLMGAALLPLEEIFNYNETVLG